MEQAETLFPKLWRDKVEAALESVVETLKDDARCASRLVDAIKYSLMAPGKRVRPLLVILAAKCVTLRSGRTFNDSLPIDTADPFYANLLHAATAVEMIHAYSLIHDDLPAMDNDDLRRGRATNHRMFDEATAILAGDALQPLAFEQLTMIRSAEMAVESCKILAIAAGAAGMVAGQMRDVGFEKQLSEYQAITGESLENRQNFLEWIHRGKTGALIGAAMELGAVLAGASRTDRNDFLRFADWVGRLYQITDDLLDLSSDVGTLGKAVHKDATLGKLTYPGLLGVDGANREADRCVTQAERIVAQFPAEARDAMMQLVQNWRRRKK